MIVCGIYNEDYFIFITKTKWKTQSITFMGRQENSKIFFSKENDTKNV